MQLQDIDRRILWIVRSWARSRNTPIAESISEKFGNASLQHDEPSAALAFFHIEISLIRFRETINWHNDDRIVTSYLQSHDYNLNYNTKERAVNEYPNVIATLELLQWHS